MKVQLSATTAEAGVALTKLHATDRLGWLFRSQLESDVGIDAHLEVVVDGRATGRLLGLQIKSGQTWFREINEDSFVYRPDDDHVQYWLSHSLPVAVVLADTDVSETYWQLITSETLTSTGKGWKLLVPRSQHLGRDSESALADAAEGDPYVLRLRQLQLARPWMEHLRDGGQLVLEVEEWVNKTSGRAALVLTATDAEGVVVGTQEWPWLIFPFANYAVELPRLFPWADLSSDVDADEDDYLAECGHWDSEDQMYFYSETFEEWSATRQAGGIHPHSENGEVALWKLNMDLSKLGEAFLVLDDRLLEGGPPPLA